MTKSELTGQQVHVWCDATSLTTTAQFNKTDTITAFYLMSDSPYTANERKNLMPAHIRRLGAGAEFLIQLGDLQPARESNCKEWAYQSASNILRKSRVPTFVLLGDNNLNDCKDVHHVEEMWTKYFRRIDERWDHDFEVTRWGDLDENFLFLHIGVLYFGVNVPGGTTYSSSDAEVRYNQHFRRIKSIVGGLSDDDYQVIVLLGHADPSYGDAGNSQAFFERFSGLVKAVGKPTVHFHGDWHEYYEVEGGDYGVDNYLRISLDGESIAPPIRVVIYASKENPIKISRVKSGVAVDCFSVGWPRSEEL